MYHLLCLQLNFQRCLYKKHDEIDRESFWNGFNKSVIFRVQKCLKIHQKILIFLLKIDSKYDDISDAIYTSFFIDFGPPKWLKIRSKSVSKTFEKIIIFQTWFFRFGSLFESIWGGPKRGHFRTVLSLTTSYGLSHEFQNFDPLVLRYVASNFSIFQNFVSNLTIVLSYVAWHFSIFQKFWIELGRNLMIFSYNLDEIWWFFESQKTCRPPPGHMPQFLCFWYLRTKLSRGVDMFY